MVVVTNATYGRMRIGRCVNRDFGYIGCSGDVLPELHRQCSGRQSCSLPLTILQEKQTACPKDLTSYLLAAYTCVKVVPCSDSMMCKASDYLKVVTPRGDPGILSSDVTLRTGCGSASCPWVLQANPGQKFNITLYDFSKGIPSKPSTTKGVDPTKVCYRYATIKEETMVTKDITVCAGDGQKDGRTARHIYTSKGHVVDVTFYTSANTDDLVHFALKYEAIGCADVAPPRNAYHRRQGDKLGVHCNFTSKAWYLTCSGTAWVGEVGLCEGSGWRTGNLLSDDSSTFGMLLIVGLGVAIGIVVGGLLLAIALLYLRRRRESLPPRDNRLLGENSIYNDCVRYNDQNLKNSIPLTPPRGNLPYPPTDHDYIGTLPHRQPMHHMIRADDPKLSAIEVAEMDDSFPPPPGFSKPRDHVYETPKFPLQDMSLRGLRVHSADGLSRHNTDCEDPRSNRTN